MTFLILLSLKMTTPKKVALVPPRRRRKNGAQADLSSMDIICTQINIKLKMGIQTARNDPMYHTRSRSTVLKYQLILPEMKHFKNVDRQIDIVKD